MGLRKAQTVLFMYERLRSDEYVNVLDFMSEFGVSYPTFHRYIAEIRAFLMNNYMPLELAYDTGKKAYHFIQI